MATVKERAAVILNNSVCYAEMGGQVGDSGEMTTDGERWRIAETRKAGASFLHILEGKDAPAVGTHVTVRYDAPRRRAVERHHTVTHLLHWALHEIVSREAVQKGSYVGPEKLTFDFSSGALTHEQVRAVEKLVNERIAENAAVSWTEIPYAEAKQRSDIQQFFGDKYGDVVRVVQIGGEAKALNGYSMELCGGTHVRGTGEIERFRIVSEVGDRGGDSPDRSGGGRRGGTLDRKRSEAAAGEIRVAGAQEERTDAVAGLFRCRFHRGSGQRVCKQLEAEVHEWEKQNAKVAEAGVARARGGNRGGVGGDACGGQFAGDGSAGGGWRAFATDRRRAEDDS